MDTGTSTIAQMYSDFTNNVLPQIQKGLVISKDYFIDLFGRYIKYLIVTDTLYTVISGLLMIGSIILFYKGIKYGQKNDWDGGAEVPMIMLGILGIILCSIWFFCSLRLLIQDIYVPEISVWQAINNFRN